MSNEASPRPWRCECGPTVNAVIAANGAVVVPHTGYQANARLIVDAVNERAKFEEARMEFPDLRPVIIAAGQRDAAIEECDRLRDIVRRLSRHLANYITSESENDLLREARAAIGEDKE